MSYALKRLGLLAVMAFAGCAAPSGAEPVAQSDQDIVGGIPAKSAKYDAVGLLYGVRSTGPAPICTGSLIGPHTVLTAGHCVRPKGAPFNIIDRFPVFFTLGYDSAHPTRTIRAVAASVTPVTDNDVGIYQLAEEVTNVAPVKVADRPLDASAVGKKFQVVGFGLQNDSQQFTDFLTRRVATLSLTTFDTHPAQVLFPSFADFKAFMEKNAGHPFTDADAHAVYDDPLVRAGDAFFGNPREAQPSYLDSGAAFFTTESGTLVAHAVNAHVYLADPTRATNGTEADLLPIGTDTSMVGVAGTAEHVAQALTDPCRGLTTAGACTAQTAVRCATELHPPVISVVDCDAVGAVCKVGADGAAACDDP